MSERSTIWLVGMMGCGKSTVGEALSRRLRLPFVDSDAEIEREAGMSVSEIFEREGEAAFRVRERAAIDAWAGKGAVVALGGGAIAQPGAAERLADTGTVAYLRASPATLERRVGLGESRPLLAGLSREQRRERLAEILDARREAYATATVVVDTDALDAEGVAVALAGRLAA